MKTVPTKTKVSRNRRKTPPEKTVMGTLLRLPKFWMARAARARACAKQEAAAHVTLTLGTHRRRRDSFTPLLPRRFELKDMQISIILKQIARTYVSRRRRRSSVVCAWPSRI